jgi:YVTN family beta-propeller protein
MNRLSCFVLVLAACGDNLSGPDAGASGDSGPTDAHVAAPIAVTAAGDFMSPGTGIVSKLDVKKLTMTQNVVPSVAQGDPVLRQYGDKLYVINRFGSNNVTILDAKTLMFEEQISTGANSNPQDVAVVGNKLYVPALGTAGVVVITRGSTAQTTIDLSALDSMGMNDGKPECVSAYVVGTKLYVACAVLDNFNAVEVGKIAVIDTATDMMVTSVNMNYKNPVGFFKASPPGSVYGGDLLIPTVPDYNNYATGCIERVSTAATPTVACGLTNQEMAGFANSLAIAADGSLMYIAVDTFDASFNQTGTLKGFDLQSGMLWAAPLSVPTELIVDVAACPGGNIVAADNTFNAGGLRVWEDTEQRTTEPKPIGLPPTVNALVCYDP